MRVGRPRRRRVRAGGCRKAPEVSPCTVRRPRSGERTRWSSDRWKTCPMPRCSSTTSSAICPRSMVTCRTVNTLKLEGHLIEVHNSRRPFDRLAVHDYSGSERYSHAGTAWLLSVSSNVFYTLWPCALDLWPFDLILIGGRGIVMAYLRAKFGELTVSRFGFIVWTE